MDDSNPNTLSSRDSQPSETTGVPPVMSACLKPVPRPPMPLVHRIFLGPNGIRAGWRFAIFVLLVAAFGFVIVSLLTFLLRGPVGKLVNAGLAGHRPKRQAV